MAFDTVIQQGRFTSDGTDIILEIRSDFDWIWAYNETVLYAAGNNDNAQAYWQRGMTNGRGVSYIKENTIGALVSQQLPQDGGFFLIDSSIDSPGAAVVVTAVTNAAQPVFSTANTGSLDTGSIVRFSDDANLPNLGGFDFEVDTIVANTSFRMRWALANAPGAVGAGAAFYRQIPFDPMYYPRRRFIVNITQAAQAVVRTSVTHGFTVGQEIRFVLPSAFGMVELNSLVGTVVAVSAANNTFTVDIDTTAMTAFAWPAVADYPFNFAQAVPLGEDTGVALANAANILADATTNNAVIGVLLTAGALRPAGIANDVIYWVAGKSFSVDNN